MPKKEHFIEKYIMDIALQNKLINAYIYVDGIEKRVKNMVSYDARTLTFVLEFENNDVQELSGTKKYLVYYNGAKKDKKININRPKN